MIYTAIEYAEAFCIGKKRVSVSTVKRRCAGNMLPSGHRARKMKGKRGLWVIEVKEN